MHLLNSYDLTGHPNICWPCLTPTWTVMNGAFCKLAPRWYLTNKSETGRQPVRMAAILLRKGRIKNNPIMNSSYSSLWTKIKLEIKMSLKYLWFDRRNAGNESYLLSLGRNWLVQSPNDIHSNQKTTHRHWWLIATRDGVFEHLTNRWSSPMN